MGARFCFHKKIANRKADECVCVVFVCVCASLEHLLTGMYHVCTFLPAANLLICSESKFGVCEQGEKHKHITQYACILAAHQTSSTSTTSVAIRPSIGLRRNWALVCGARTHDIIHPLHLNRCDRRHYIIVS